MNREALGRRFARLVTNAVVARPTLWPLFRGPMRAQFERLAAGWAEFDAWIRAAGHEPGPDFWERYVTGPESGADPETFRTELNRPLVRVGG